MSPADRLATACVFTLGATLAVAGAHLGAIAAEPLEPVPLRRAAVATPVAFPTTPLIRVTPMFVSTAETPIALGPWHRQALMHWYLPEPPAAPGEE